MKYATPAAFKTALEQRLRTIDPKVITRNRQLIIFSRFLARVIAVLGEAATLKGGLALELRLGRARTTKDIDLGLRGMRGEREVVLEKLQQAARVDLGDYLTFEVEVDPDHPDIENDGMKYEGYRFRASCTLAGKEYGRRWFGIDVALGDPIDGEADQLVTEDWLAFAGIPATTVRAYRVERHVAEKLHAYTLPRDRPNSRMKDLPDLALLASAGALQRFHLRAAIEATFASRATHALPPSLPDPPPEWSERYERLAAEEELEWRTLSDLVERVRAFMNPVLDPEGHQRWNVEAWAWVQE